MALTSGERSSFTAANLAELDRMANVDRLIVLDTSDYTKNQGETDQQFADRKAADAAAFRAKVVGQLANLTPEQLKARVNVVGARGSTLVYSEDNNYTAAEQAAIADGYKGNVGRSFVREVPRILADVAELQTELGAEATMSARTRAALIKHLMKAR